jgi:hypothetical protein
MTQPEKMTFDRPSETRTFPFGKIDLIDIGGSQIGRLTLEPGWRWSEHVQPLAGTEWWGASTYAQESQHQH